MNSFLKIPVLVILAGLVSSIRASTNCKEMNTEIEKCFLQIYTMYGSTSTGQVQLSELSDYQQLDEICEELQTSTDCTERILNKCHEAQVSDMIISTLTDTFGYICGEGRHTLIEEVSCWQNPSFQSSLTTCEHESKMAAQRARSMSDVCGILSDYTTCVQNEVTSLCNEKAGNFIYNVFNHATAAVTKQMGCAAHLIHTRSIMGLLSRRGAQKK
ncbi:uncharacterized protein LOC121384428 [Gigantopelta aegis]|uniref:uncharacterized protein LOC121384428 n=1 Tax=Gigantopelta aegis TaxID=1735272 RepID=UPI001B88A15C|nr:uncharacterized protein LOC121384428 [Gigantopelta aegis]